MGHQAARPGCAASEALLGVAHVGSGGGGVAHRHNGDCKGAVVALAGAAGEEAVGATLAEGEVGGDALGDLGLPLALKPRCGVGPRLARAEAAGLIGMEGGWEEG